MRCRELNIEAYLAKPIRASDLSQVIRRLFPVGVNAGEGATDLITRHKLREANQERHSADSSVARFSG